MTSIGSTRQRFDALPQPASDWALFLDLDGTISEIAPRPEAAVVLPAVIDALARIEQALDGALALVSGRSLTDLDRLVHPLRPAAAGQHGAEWRMANGPVQTAPGLSSDDLRGVRDAFHAYAATNPGVIVEEKSLSVSIHFRLAPAAAEEIRAMAEGLAKTVPDYHLLAGKAVVEFRPNGVDKGACIERFLGGAPFASRTPVFAGDDVTDEDGFGVINRRGGISIRIGDSFASPTKAKWQCPDVATFTRWLADLPDRLDHHG